MENGSPDLPIPSLLSFQSLSPTCDDQPTRTLESGICSGREPSLETASSQPANLETHFFKTRLWKLLSVFRYDGTQFRPLASPTFDSDQAACAPTAATAHRPAETWKLEIAMTAEFCEAARASRALRPASARRVAGLAALMDACASCGARTTQAEQLSCRLGDAQPPVSSHACAGTRTERRNWSANR